MALTDPPFASTSRSLSRKPGARRPGAEPEKRFPGPIDPAPVGPSAPHPRPSASGGSDRPSAFEVCFGPVGREAGGWGGCSKFYMKWFGETSVRRGGCRRHVCVCVDSVVACVHDGSMEVGVIEGEVGGGWVRKIMKWFWRTFFVSVDAEVRKGRL